MESDCIEQYKINVINSYINSAFKISVTDDFMKKNQTIFKGILINNEHDIGMIDKQINKRYDINQQKEKRK